jgi:FG-GAP-like repeat
VSVAGQSFTVNQSGAGLTCSYSLPNTTQMIANSGTTGTASITAPAGCTWSALSNSAWIVITSGSSGAGNGVVGYSASVNTASGPRSGTINIGGQTFTIIQSGVPKIDFNGDGFSDILWQDPVSGLAQVWLLSGAQGTTISGAANLTASNTWRIVGVGDFNRDGHPDVVWQDPVSGAAQVWFLGGAQGNLVIGAAVLSNGNAWRIMSVGDFNGDGQPDCAWQDPVTGHAQIWFMGGNQGVTVIGAANLTSSNTWRIVGQATLMGTVIRTCSGRIR